MKGRVVSPTICGRPPNILYIKFIAHLERKNTEKMCHGQAANGNANPRPSPVWNIVAFGWVMSPLLSVLNNPVYSLLFLNGTLWSNYRTEHKNLIKGSWLWKGVFFVFISNKPSGMGSFPKIMHWMLRSQTNSFICVTAGVKCAHHLC